MIEKSLLFLNLVNITNSIQLNQCNFFNRIIFYFIKSSIIFLFLEFQHFKIHIFIHLFITYYLTVDGIQLHILKIFMIKVYKCIKCDKIVFRRIFLTFYLKHVQFALNPLNFFTALCANNNF